MLTDSIQIQKLVNGAERPIVTQNNIVISETTNKKTAF